MIKMLCVIPHSGKQICVLRMNYVVVIVVVVRPAGFITFPILIDLSFLYLNLRDKFKPNNCF